MARRAVGVDVGAHSVKVAEMTREGNRAHLTRWAVQEIAGSSAAARAQALARAMRSAGITQRRVICAVPRPEATVKRIRLPASDRETVRKILAFEAQQHLPFPLEQVAWDFDLAGSQGSALLVAARKTLIEEARALLAQAGLRAGAMGITSVAAATAYLHGEGDEPGGDDSACVLLEMDGGYLVANVLRANGLHLSRPLPISGDDLVRAFAQDLGCEVEAAVESMRTRGMEALPEAAARVGEWMRTLRGEVERSLLAAAEGEPSLSVGRVVVTGGGWQTPGLAAAVASVLGVSVAVFPPASRQVPAALGTAIGLALQGLGLARGVNLLSASTMRARRTSKRWIASAAAVAALLAALGVGTRQYMVSQSAALARQPVLARAESRARETKALLSKEKRLKARLGEVQAALQRRGVALDTLRLLSERAPGGTWLTSISCAPGRPVTVQGKALSAETVAKLIEALGSGSALTYVKQGDRGVDFAIAVAPGQEGG